MPSRQIRKLVSRISAWLSGAAEAIGRSSAHRLSGQGGSGIPNIRKAFPPKHFPIASSAEHILRNLHLAGDEGLMDAFGIRMTLAAPHRKTLVFHVLHVPRASSASLASLGELTKWFWPRHRKFHSCFG